MAKMRWFLVLGLIAIAQDLVTPIILNKTLGTKNEQNQRIKRGAEQSNDQGRSPAIIGNFFEHDRFRNNRFCNRRFSTSRIVATESNILLPLVITKVEKNGRSLEFFEEFGMFSVSSVNRREYSGKAFDAYYFPYYNGEPGLNGELNVGWVDIPKNPNARQPKLAITGGMNGCATVIMSFKDGRQMMRVYHLQSPGPKNGERWDRYIRIIKHHHEEVDNVITSFAWEDYGGNIYI